MDFFVGMFFFVKLRRLPFLFEGGDVRGILSGYGNVWENIFWVGQKPFENICGRVYDFFFWNFF